MRPLPILCLALAAGCAPRAARTPDATPVYAAGDTASLLGPGVVSTDDAFAASLTPDGRTVFFTRANRDRTRMRILRARWTGAGWGAPEPLPFDAAPRAMDPFVSPDGTRLYFTAARRLQAARGEPQDDWDTWVADLAPDGTVGAPRNLGAPANGEHSEMYPGATRDGTLYFQRWLPDSIARGVRGIWRLAPGAAAPERLEGPVNDGDSPGNPYVTPDGRLLLFTADRPGGHGRGDVWASARAADGSWGAPRNLGPRVNGPDVEFCPSLSPDGRWLLFSRIGYRGDERVRDNVYVIRADAVPALRELLNE